MNTWDRDNLNFLLTASRKTLEDWHDQADEDDLAYAMELLQQASDELTLKELAVLDQVADEDLTAAQAVLSKFRL
jgi:hypothetical protein